MFDFLRVGELRKAHGGKTQVGAPGRELSFSARPDVQSGTFPSRFQGAKFSMMN